jgi:molecular chaperone DnaJ
MFQTPHSVLGVQPDASEAQIRSAFAAKIKEVHPDHGGSGDPEVFSRLSKARADALAALSSRRDEDPGESPFDRLFDQIDGLGAGKLDGRSSDVGADLDVVVEISAAMLAEGGTVRRRLRCDCNACSPDSPGTSTCRRCGGSGKRTVVRRMVSVEMDCPDCRRTGRIPSDRAECLSPGGEPVQIRVRRGSRSGDVSSVKGMGYPGPGGRGNLLVRLKEGKGNQSDRPGRTSREAEAPAHHLLDVSVVDAAVGATVFTTPAGYGAMSVRVRPGTQPGAFIDHPDGLGGTVRFLVRVTIPDASEGAARQAFEGLRNYC